MNDGNIAYTPLPLLPSALHDKTQTLLDMVSGNEGCIGRRDWSIGPKVQDMFQPIPGIDHQLCWDA